MAPLPPNNSDVYFFDYTTGRVEHTFQVRVATPVPRVDVMDAVANAFEQIDNLLPSVWKFIGARFREQGSGITLPVTLGSNVATFAGTAGSIAEELEPREWTWQGRGLTSGRQLDISVYGLNLNVPPSYRYTHAGGPPSLGAFREALEQAFPVFCTVARDQPVWYPYTNVNFNSYWESRARKGL